jgi:histidine triad (HIT) family protein
MEKDECIFCKIVKGEIPAAKIWEDKEHLAFLDANPYVRGHLLVIPKEHSGWLWDMDMDKYKKLKEKIYYLANILRKAFDTDWVEEVVAGIGVNHTHIHLLPRKRNDGLGELPRKPIEPKLSDKEMKELAEKIRSKI